MEKITTQNEWEYMTITKLFNNDILISSYDESSFEGSNVRLNKEQTKELINKLQVLIYSDEE